MTIEIREPELEALIRQRMQSGAFRNVEDVLLQALKSTPLPTSLAPEPINSTGDSLIAAMQASPYKIVNVEPARTYLPVRDIAL